MQSFDASYDGEKSRAYSKMLFNLLKVNIASLMGITGVRHMTDYCASKFGSVGFSESLRQDLSDT